MWEVGGDGAEISEVVVAAMTAAVAAGAKEAARATIAATAAKSHSQPPHSLAPPTPNCGADGGVAAALYHLAPPVPTVDQWY